MYQYLKFKPQDAVNQWAQPLMEATGVQDKDKLNWMSRLAAVKMMIDGPINESENKLVESYGLSTPEAGPGMGASSWPSNPGSGVGASQGAWSQPSYVKGSGDIPTAIMGLAMNTAAFTVGFDLLTTIPVDMPTAIFQFLDAVYGGGNMETKGGAPQYLALSAAEINASFSWSSFTYGQDVFICEPSAANGKAIRGKFMGKSQFTGELLFKFESTGSITTLVYTAATTDSVTDVLTALGATAAIAPGSTATAVDGTAIALTSPQINFVSAIREHIPAASNNDGITKAAMSRATAEKGTDRKVQLKLWSKTTEMKAVEILADITRIQLRDLKAYGVDGLSMLYKAAQNQLSQTINDQIIDAMNGLGVRNHAQMLTSQGLNLNLFVGPAGTANKALTAFPSAAKFVDNIGTSRASAFGNVVNAESNSAAENTSTRQRRIYSRLLAGSNIVGNTSRAGAGDVAVVNTQLGTALQDAKGFLLAPADNTINTSDLHFIGTAGRVKVYVNPKWSWDDTRMVIGRKGTEEDSGLKFLAYDLANSVEIVDPGTMAPKLSVLSRYDIIEAGYYPEANYLTILFANDFGSFV